jgi:hypothetical protein
MKRLLALTALLWVGLVSLTAQSVIMGKVTDALTGEGIPGALITARSTSAISLSDGSFKLSLPPGIYKMTATLDGYGTDSLVIQADRNIIPDVIFKLENLSTEVQAIQITASIAKDRKTPIAHSNLTGKTIGEQLGSADMPMLLNTTPGVYATQQGGGAGDARITIRGFNQRNIAVMIDGIPVNDMENGEVYWSNWFGLSEVTALTQVQRGLGSSRIANPAVGGTMNIITRGVSPKFKASASVEMGDSRYQKYSATINTGKLKGNWGAIFSFTRRSSTGYVDALFDDMYSYYGRIEKHFGKKQTLSLTAVGAPQSHGQRSFRARLSLYDHALAQQLGMDTILPNMAVNQGRKYNQHWGWLNEARVEAVGDTIWSERYKKNERVNMFHKPQIYLKHDWKINSKTLVSSVAYISIASGGGVQSYSSILGQQGTYGLYNMQGAWWQNTRGTAFVPNPDPAYSSTELKSSAILQRNVNNHKWLGMLSTINHKINRNLNFSGGFDLRTYRAQHYSQVFDLLGGDYFIPNPGDRNPRQSGEMYRKGDVIRYNNDGLVRWAGVFGELEAVKNRTTGFMNVSLNNSWYRRIDFFRLDTNGNDKVSPWVTRPGATFKSGINHNLNRHWNIFTNVGYLNRPTRFNNVFDNNNREVRDALNEQVYAWESGVGFKSKVFSLDLNTYYTYWQNRPANSLPSFRDPDGNLYYYNINGMKARHMGIELAGVIKPGNGITIQSALSLADWQWKSGARSIIRNDMGDSVGIVDFDATGVHVGDAAQNQWTWSLRWEPTLLRGAYISAQYVYFWKHFADFDPLALTGNFKRTESFKIPAYWYLNLSAGYNFNIHKGTQASVYVNCQNITNNLYISDAQHRFINNAPPSSTFNPRNLEVFVSPGLRYTTGLRISF